MGSLGISQLRFSGVSGESLRTKEQLDRPLRRDSRELHSRRQIAHLYCADQLLSEQLWTVRKVERRSQMVDHKRYVCLVPTLALAPGVSAVYQLSGAIVVDCSYPLAVIACSGPHLLPCYRPDAETTRLER